MKLNRRLLPCTLAIGLVVGAAAGASWAADTNNQADIAKRIDASAKVLDEIMANPDKAIPDGVIKRATCVAVFPSTIQVAVLVGAKHGKGVATCRTAKGWSAPAPVDLSGGSWGAQLGGEDVDLIMVITTDKGMQQFTSSKFNLGTETSVTAGPVGNHEWRMNADVLTYSRSKGAFAGTNFSGSSVTEDESDTLSLYGSPASLADILGGKTRTPGVGHPFLEAVEKYAGPRKPHD
jgi:lipid-binding SYLF domain-containing protein